MLHELCARKDTVHWGYFSASLAPVLRVRSGDLIQVEAVTHHAGDAPELLMDDAIRQLFADIPDTDRHPGPHVMTGPIAVEGAKPGDLLEVRYLAMRPRFAYGANLAAPWGHLYGEFGKARVTIYQLDRPNACASALFAYDYPGAYDRPGRLTDVSTCGCEPALPGIRIPLRPHLGTAGVAPAVSGRVSTVPPGAHGGNIDNWRIGAGTTMYYPVAVDDALFSVGDPHVSQGDGEISGTAIEASLDVLMQIVLRRDVHFPSPLLQTPDDWIVHAFDPDLNLAMRGASLEMLRFLTECCGLSRDDAYSLMSVAVDFTVTQVVDQRQGVHARVSRSIFPAGAGGAFAC